MDYYEGALLSLGVEDDRTEEQKNILGFAENKDKVMFFKGKPKSGKTIGSILFLLKVVNPDDGPLQAIVFCNDPYQAAEFCNFINYGRHSPLSAQILSPQSTYNPTNPPNILFTTPLTWYSYFQNINLADLNFKYCIVDDANKLLVHDVPIKEALNQLKDSLRKLLIISTTDVRKKYEPFLPE